MPFSAEENQARAENHGGRSDSCRQCHAGVFSNLFEDLLCCGSEAAQEGAQATKNMCASVGRSKGFKAESLGIMDPGAVSVSRLFGGFYRYISEIKTDISV